MTDTTDPRILDLEIERHRLECEKLRAEIEQARLPLWKRSGYVASLSPIVIALVAFFSAWVTGYFDTQKKVLERDVAMLVQTRDALDREKDDLQNRLTELAKRRDELTDENARLQGKVTDLTGRRDQLSAEITTLQKKIDDAYLRLLVVAGEAGYALSHFRAFEIGAKLDDLIKQVRALPESSAIVKTLEDIREEERILREILEITEKDVDAVGKTLGVLPASGWAKQSRHDPPLGRDAVWTADGKVLDIESGRIFETIESWRASREDGQ